MTLNQQKEELSRVYVHAVAARGGFKLGEWHVDDGCLDVSIAAGGTLGGGKYADPCVNVQLKCTSRLSVVKPDHIAWSLKRAHYEQLIASKIAPHLLVVLVLPAQQQMWLEHSVDELILRRCAFWVRMTGMPPVSTPTVRVALPRTNVFSPEQLHSILTTISKTGKL